MMQGLSFAVSILVSNAFGRKDLGSVREYARKGYFMTLGISATLSVLLYCFRYQAAGIFTNSPEVSAMAVSLSSCSSPTSSATVSSSASPTCCVASRTSSRLCTPRS